MDNVITIVHTFLAQIPGLGEPDEYIVDYVKAALVVLGDDESLHDLDDALVSISPEFGNMPESTRLDMLLDVYHKVQKSKADNGKEQDSNSMQPCSVIPELQPLQHQQQGCHRQGPTEPSATAVACSQSQVADEQVDYLLALCSCQISRAYGTHLLLKFKGDMQATADFILETHDLNDQEAAYLQQQQELAEQRKQEEIDNERARKNIVARFALQEVREQPPNRKPATKDAITPALWVKAEQPKVRFLNGMPVSVRKGEKYVVESLKEEWDGGSKGKVYTKGKRGKGFM